MIYQVEEKADTPKEETEDATKEDLPTLMRKYGVFFTILFFSFSFLPVFFFPRAHVLKKAVDAELMSSKVVELERKRATAAESALAAEMTSRARRARLRAKAEELQAEIARLKAARRPGGRVETAMTTFTSPQFAKAERETAFQLVAKITLPSSSSSSEKVRTVPLIVGPSQLRQIHAKVMG